MVVKCPFTIDSRFRLSAEEAKQLKNDEKMALESIYGDDFKERLPDRVWELALSLDSLWDLAHAEPATGSVIMLKVY